MAIDEQEAGEDRLARLEAMVVAQQDELAAQRRTIASQQQQIDRLAAGDTEARWVEGRPSIAHPTPTPPAVAAPEARPPEVGRRRMLTRGLAAAGAVAAGTVLADGAPAAAAAGGPVLLGRSNDSDGFATVLTSSAPSASFQVVGPLLTSTYLTSSHPQGTALFVGGRRTHIAFDVRSDRNAPIYDAGSHLRGEMVVDKFGTLWYCGASGAPGSWRAVAGPGEAGAFYPHPAPVRIYDSRPGTSPAAGSKTKLAAGATRTINMRTSGATNEYGRAVMVQVLLVGAAAGPGNFTIWSSGVPKPLANTMVWGGSAGRFSTLAYTNMDLAGNVQIHASLATDVVIDVIAQYC